MPRLPPKAERLLPAPARARLARAAAPPRDGPQARRPPPGRLPRARTPVTLLAAGGERIPAWVQSNEPELLTLVSVIPLPALTAESLEGMVLEFAVAAGRIRLGGEFAAADAEAAELLLLRKPHVIEVVQERVFPRTRLSLPITISLDGGRARLRAYTVDISGGGCLVDGAAWLKVGDSVGFEVRLSALEAPVTGAGRVVRIDSRGRRAIAFDAVDGERWQQLVDFVGGRLPSRRH